MIIIITRYHFNNDAKSFIVSIILLLYDGRISVRTILNCLKWLFFIDWLLKLY